MSLPLVAGTEMIKSMSTKIWRALYYQRNQKPGPKTA